MMQPFPGTSIARFLSTASPVHRGLFALSSAQRAWTLAEDVLHGVQSEDREVLLGALDTCWSVRDTRDVSTLTSLLPPLMARLVDEDDESYGFYNSVVNDALTSTIYSIRAWEDSTESRSSARYAAETFYNLVDMLLHRDEVRYVKNLAAEPMMHDAAECIERDTTSVGNIRGPKDSAYYRDLCIADGHHIARLASDN